jgi:hypothetical protein
MARVLELSDQEVTKRNKNNYAYMLKALMEKVDMHRWLMPVILVTWEAEIRRIEA